MHHLAQLRRVFVTTEAAHFTVRAPKVTSWIEGNLLDRGPLTPLLIALVGKSARSLT